ncbi:MAG: SDR family NAD(P)-dependent oxidoreductase, partial [Bacteroidota bacterium]
MHTWLHTQLRTRYGPWAIVTGASEGIGRALADQLAASGIHLVLVARRQAVLQALADTYTAQYPIETRVVAVDLATETGWKTVTRATKDLDVGLLVASAGFGTSGLFIDNDLNNELDMVNVNCRALLALTHHYGRRFAAQKRGGIILMSSLLA